MTLNQIHQRLNLYGEYQAYWLDEHCRYLFNARETMQAFKDYGFMMINHDDLKPPLNFDQWLFYTDHNELSGFAPAMRVIIGGKMFTKMKSDGITYNFMDFPGFNQPNY